MSIKENISSNIKKIVNYGVREADSHRNKFIPKTGLDLAVHLTTHCNLNCKNCDTYAPIASKGEQDLDSLEQDLKRLSEIMGPDRIHTLHLSGGEPLLHSRIEEIPALVRKYLPRTYIYFITNGTMLPRMTDKFYRECHDNFINIEVTIYPIKFDYESAFEMVRSKGVQIVNYHEHEPVKTSWHFPVNFDGSCDPVKNFTICDRANYCHVLFDHRLYTCSAIPRIRILNYYFKTNVPISEYDGIDIYKAKSGQEILEFLARPVPFCRFCDHDKYTYGHKWGVSKKDIMEWSSCEPNELKNKLYSANIETHEPK